MSKPNEAAIEPVALRALDLLSQWRRAVQGHVPLPGGGCACVLGVAGVAVADFELPVLDYLYGRHGGAESLRALFEEAGYAPGVRGQIAELLVAVARRRDGPFGTGALLDDLQRSIDSFIRVEMQDDRFVETGTCIN